MMQTYRENTRKLSSHTRSVFISHQRHRSSLPVDNPQEDEQSVSRFSRLSRAAGYSDYALFLRHCSKCRISQEGRLVHLHIVEHCHEQYTFIGNLLIQMYGKCGDLIDALSIFDGLCFKNLYSWNIMISVYVDHGHGRKALGVFQQMLNHKVTPHQATFVSVLSACALEGSLAEGKWINEYTDICGVELDSLVGSALVNMYGKCGSPEAAEEVFDRLTERDVVTWSSMISMYAQQGNIDGAFQFFRQMQLIGIIPNQVTYLSLIDACSSLTCLQTAVCLHATLMKTDYAQDLMVGNAIVNMYGKCGNLENARTMFDIIPKRNVVSWSSLIGAHAQQGHGKNALELFSKMHHEKIDPDRITFINTLDACASCAALAKGRVVHLYLIEKGFENDVVAGTSVINFYAKCGKLVDAGIMFARMTVRNVISWNAMISGYAQHGQSKLALRLYADMQTKGIMPTKVTFFGVLSACSFAGRMDEAQKHFDSMERDYALTPEAVHYNCIIDLLGRAGRVEDCENLIRRMPCEPTVASWMTLLAACRVKQDIERAQFAAMKIAQLEPESAAPFVLLSNIYAASGRWEDVMNVRKHIKEKGLKRQAGRSLIEIDGTIHEFSVADESHPRCEEIYAEIDRLHREMKEAGYSPDTKVVLHDVDEATKEHLICYHSEKIALAFGLITTPAPTSIRIIKNLRACSDCHSAIKFISKITQREIIVRDASRFHHIRDGICSCADYW